MLRKKLLAGVLGLTAVSAVPAADLVVATVNNGHMIEMQKLTSHFEKAYPDIKVLSGGKERAQMAPLVLPILDCIVMPMGTVRFTSSCSPP